MLTVDSPFTQSSVESCCAPQKNPDGVLLYQQAFRQMRAFSSQLQISPLSSAISKPKQAKLIMYNLGENNYELPM